MNVASWLLKSRITSSMYEKKILYASVHFILMFKRSLFRCKRFACYRVIPIGSGHHDIENKFCLNIIYFALVLCGKEF